MNEFDPLFEDVYAYCEKMELNVDTLIHEVGAGQMEINFFHAHPLGLADEVFFFKRTLREAAMRHDMFATFMAKPIAGEPGSAMHVHQSVVDKTTGHNIFSNPDGTPSQEFFWYIGGLQKYIPAAMALFAPYVNSYRRLVRSNAAPINIQWGTDNRTVGIRSPVATPSARRVENRVIGADANPYVALAATLACGYLGIKNRIEPSARVQGRRLPGRLPAAAQPGRGAEPAARRDRPGRGAGRVLRHRLHRGQGDRVRRVHEGHLALGAGTSLAPRLRR